MITHIVAMGRNQVIGKDNKAQPNPKKYTIATIICFKKIKSKMYLFFFQKKKKYLRFDW